MGLALLANDQGQGAKALDWPIRRFPFAGRWETAPAKAILAQIAAAYATAGDKPWALDYATQARDAFQAAHRHRDEASALGSHSWSYFSSRTSISSPTP